MTISQLSFTNSMSGSKRPFLTDLVQSLTSIQTHINDKLVDNLNALSLDAYGSGYSHDDDGVAQYNDNLYNRRYAKQSYTGGDKTISTVGEWTDVDTANAAISITPELVGDFTITAQFSVESVSSNATNETDIRFRLTDGSTASTATPRVQLVTGVTATKNTVPVNLQFTYEDMAASSQTVKLQYFITASTATVIKVLANSNDPIYLEAVKS